MTSYSHHKDLHSVIKAISKAGFYEALLYIEEAGSPHYNDILRFAFENKLVRSRASVTTIVNSLTDLELLDRQVLAHARPVRTMYTLSKKGKIVLQHLKEIEKAIK